MHAQSGYICWVLPSGRMTCIPNDARTEAALCRYAETNPRVIFFVCDEDPLNTKVRHIQ